jgi:tetratricopeptide (TPR) repeat protein
VTSDYLKKICILFLLFRICGTEAQTLKTDSLLRELQKIPAHSPGTAADTLACNILNALVEYTEDEAGWLGYNEQAMNICRKGLAVVKENHPLFHYYAIRLSSALGNAADPLIRESKSQEALKLCLESKYWAERAGEPETVAFVCGNIGFIYQRTGNMPKALDYMYAGLTSFEKAGNKKGQAAALVNIGSVHERQGDLQKAREEYERAATLQGEVNDQTGLSYSLNNIGVLLNKSGKTAEALQYYYRALKMREAVNDKQGIANSLINIGSAYQEKSAILWPGDNGAGISRGRDTAEKYYNKALLLYRESGYKDGECYTLYNLGSLYYQRGNDAQATRFCFRSLSLARETGNPVNIRNCSEVLAGIYKRNGNFKLAVSHYTMFIKMRDSINNESTRKASVRSQLSYEYGKQAAADSVARARENTVKNMLLEKQRAEISVKKNQQYALFGGLALLVFLTALIYNRFKLTQKQRLIIEAQKSEVELQKKIMDEKQKELLDSIYYARKIQRAHLPSEKKLENILNRVRKS